MGKPPETTPFDRRWRRPVSWGFAHDAQATRADSLTIAAGGLQAKGRLSFKTGIFGAIEPPKAANRGLWDKNKKLNVLSLKKKFLKLSQLLSPKPTKHNKALPDGIRFETALKTGCNWTDGTTEPKPSSGSDFRGLTLLNTIFQKLTFPQVKKGFRSIRTEPFLTE